MRRSILFFASAIQALATTYYIDYEAGDDANNGTSPATPWKHYPMDARAGGIADTTTIVGGDVLAPKGGVEYVNSARRQFPNGTVGNRVIVDGGLWGTGKAIEVGNNQAYGAWFDNGQARGNFTIRNFIYRDFGGYADASTIWDGITIASVDAGTDTFTTAAEHGFSVGADIMFSVSSGGSYPAPVTGGVGSTQLYYVKTVPTPTTFTASTSVGGATLNVTTSGSGTIKVWEPVLSPPDARIFEMTGGGENVTFEDLEMYEIGQWKNTFPMWGTNSVTGMGFWLQSVNNVLIEDCIMQRMGRGFQITATAAGGAVSGVTVNRCQLSDSFVWCFDVFPYGANAVLEDITISNCKVFDYLQHDQGNWAAFGEKPHSNGIFLRTSGYSSTWNNIRIHGNEFFIDNPGNSAGGTADIFISEGPSALIYNNLFFKTRKANAAINVGWWSAMPGQTVRVYNNTFFGSTTWIRSGIENRSGYRSLHFQNNLGIANGTASNLIMVYQETGTNLLATLDKNLYYHPSYSSSNNRMFGVNGWIYANLAQVQSMGVSPPRPTQFEANSLYANPLVADTVGSFAETNFRVLAGSPAIGMGENLSAYFSTDKDGNARPATGAWDVGAYVYDSDPPVDSTAPTLVSATIDATGGLLTLVWDEPVQGVDAAHYSISGHTLATPTGSGTTRTIPITPAVQAAAVKTLVYTAGAGRTRDLADNLLASFLITSGTPGFANNSLETTPVPPRPGGLGPRRGNRIR